MSAADLLRDVVRALDDAGVPHMLGGSFASTAYGAPRSTQDIDIVIDPTPEALDRFVGALDRAGSTSSRPLDVRSPNATSSTSSI